MVFIFQVGNPLEAKWTPTKITTMDKIIIYLRKSIFTCRSLACKNTKKIKHHKNRHLLSKKSPKSLSLNSSLHPSHPRSPPLASPLLPPLLPSLPGYGGGCPPLPPRFIRMKGAGGGRWQRRLPSLLPDPAGGRGEDGGGGGSRQWRQWPPLPFSPSPSQNPNHRSGRRWVGCGGNVARGGWGWPGVVAIFFVRAKFFCRQVPMAPAKMEMQPANFAGRLMCTGGPLPLPPSPPQKMIFSRLKKRFS